MIPVTPIFNCPLHEGLFKLRKGLTKLREQELAMVVIRDTSVFWVPADVNNFAAFGSEEFCIQSISPTYYKQLFVNYEKILTLVV